MRIKSSADLTSNTLLTVVKIILSKENTKDLKGWISTAWGNCVGGNKRNLKPVSMYKTMKRQTFLMSFVLVSQQNTEITSDGALGIGIQIMIPLHVRKM